ncbi:hypothetical protein C8J57DRAFT_721442 [Mycena rebaudengoi]|nr:hypothetical protein C8J57DRAFT_721442 [Mycena rebaudengoi]
MVLAASCRLRLSCSSRDPSSSSAFWGRGRGIWRRMCRFSAAIGATSTFYTLIFRFSPFFRLIRLAPREFSFVWAIFSLPSQRLLCPHLHAVARAATPAGPDRFADAISRLLDVTNPGWFIDARSPRPQDLGVFLGGCFSANLASCMFSRPSIAVIFVWEFREECIGDDRPVLECSAGSRCVVSTYIYIFRSF